VNLISKQATAIHHNANSAQQQSVTSHRLETIAEHIGYAWQQMFQMIFFTIVNVNGKSKSFKNWLEPKSQITINRLIWIKDISRRMWS